MWGAFAILPLVVSIMPAYVINGTMIRSAIAVENERKPHEDIVQDE
jgi:hypothetical protein